MSKKEPPDEIILLCYNDDVGNAIVLTDEELARKQQKNMRDYKFFKYKRIKDG